MKKISKTAHRLFVCICCFFISKNCPSQAVVTPYYNFKTYTVNDGLASNRVSYTCKDSRGFLWVGTDRGLQRFNGSSFLGFRHLNNDSTSIIDDAVFFILEDSHHDIWVSTLKGVSKFNYKNGKFINYAYGWKGNTKEPIVDMFWLFEDSRGRFWAGARSGLYLFDSFKNQFNNILPENIPGLNEGHFVRVGCIKETAKQELVFTVVDGFVIMDKDGKQQHFPVPEPTIKPVNHLPVGQVFLLKDYPDEIWLTPNLNGLYKYERSSGKWSNYRSKGVMNNDYVKGCLEWDKETWLLGGDNVAFFNHRMGTFKATGFDINKILHVNSVFKEANGNIWFPSLSKGLSLLNPSEQLFTSTSLLPGSFSDKIFYFDKVQNAVYGMNIYFASGILKLELPSGKITKDSIPHFKPLVTILNNYMADDDILYLAMEKGFWKYDLHTRQLKPVEFADADNFSSQKAFFFNLCKSANNIYVTGRFGKGGPFVYNKSTGSVTDLALAFKNTNGASPGNYQPDFSPYPGTAHGQVNKKDLPLVYQRAHEPKVYSYCLAMNNDVLYVGMNAFDSLYTYNEKTFTKQAIAFSSAYTIGKPCSVLSLCTDKNKNLWCGTANNGIFIYNTVSGKWIKHISQPDGYFPVMTTQIVSDEDGMLWCNSSEGLFLFNPDNFRYKKYGSNDGLGHENSVGTLVVMPGHKLLYNNVDKYLYDWTWGNINTKPADTFVQTIPISISQLKVIGNIFLADTLLDNVQEIILPPHQNSFSLSYAGVSLTEGKNLLYSYTLEGAESNWHIVDNDQSLLYNNLSPGAFKLHIKCKSRDERTIGLERIIQIVLLPAWYQTWWFKVLVIFVCSFLSFIAIHYYLRQQLKKQQAILEKERALTEERNRIAADMHDDVGAGLSRIRYITSSLQSNQAISDADISKIVALSDESVEKMNEIIWALNQGNQQLDELIYYTRSQCSEMVSNAGLAFTFDLPENIPNKILGWKDCRNIYLLVKETVNNAIKHAGASSIVIECSITDQIQFSIADNGRGFNPDTLKTNGNGLPNYKKRVEKLGGSYQIITAVREGTKLLFVIPLNDFNKTLS